MNTEIYPEFPLEPGDTTTRRKMIDLYGGSLMNGIVTTRGSNIFAYSDPKSSKLNGYIHDGWEDESEEVLFYTGEGQIGDQKMTGGNKAILEHARNGKAIRFFETLPVKASGGKKQRYIGEFMVAPDAPYRWEKAPDREKNIRDVIVFRLFRISASSSDLLGDTHFAHLSKKEISNDLVVDLAFPEAIDLEVYYTNEFEVAATSPRTSIRKESDLVDGFNSTLKGLGHELKRYKIPLEEGGSPLLTDTFDLTESVLWEAKAFAGRGEVRLAIGQIFDYQRYLKRTIPDFSTGIVLPVRPVTSVMDLALEAGHRVAYLDSSAWKVQTPEGPLVTLG